MVIFNNFNDLLDILPNNGTVHLPVSKQTPLKIKYSVKEPLKTVYGSSEPGYPFADSEIFEANISDSRRLTAQDERCKTVYEVSFNVAESNFKFKAGDTIGIIPHNDDSDVNFVASHLDLVSNLDVPYTLFVDGKQKAKIPTHVPIKSTLRHVLTHCLDLKSILKKLFLLALSEHTSDENEKYILQYLCSKEGASAYTTHILERNLSLLDIFTIFHSCKPPMEVLLGNLPRLLPRPYSIVNSGLTNNNEIKICFSVMTINHRRGLTTGWLEDMILSKKLNLEQQMMNLNLQNGHQAVKKVPLYLRKNLNEFYLPPDHETPLILISPGTGVAPFIGFLDEREYHKNSNKELQLGDVWLFFGSRNPKLDFIYVDELNGFKNRGILTKIRTAFSQVEDTNAKYVQDAVLQNGKAVTDLIKNGAFIYVCGDLKTMAIQVKGILVKCLMEHDNMTQMDAETLLSDMQKGRKYLVDAWS